MVGEHRLVLSRRPGQYREYFAIRPVKHSNRRAVRIWQDLGAIDDVRLPLIDLGHLAAPVAKPFAQVTLDLCVIDEFSINRPCRKLARNVVGRRPKTAGCYHNIRSSQRISNSLLQPRAVVTDHRLELYVDTYIVEFFGKPKAVGVS